MASKTSLIRLEVKKAFKASQNQILHSIKSLMAKEIDNLLAPTRSASRNPSDAAPQAPSKAIRDTIAFLTETKERLQGSMEKQSVGLLLQCAKENLASNLLGILYDPAVSGMSLDYVQGFSDDAQFLQSSISQLFEALVDGNDSQADPFEELNQTLGLLLAQSCHSYMDPIVRMEQYPRLDSNKITSLLAKVNQPAAKKLSIEDLILLLGKQQ